MDLFPSGLFLGLSAIWISFSRRCLFMFLILFLPFPSLLLPFHLSLFVSLVFLSSSIYFASCHFSLPFNLPLLSLFLFRFTSLPLLILSYSSSSLHFSFISFIYALLSPLPPPIPLSRHPNTHTQEFTRPNFSLFFLLFCFPFPLVSYPSPHFPHQEQNSYEVFALLSTRGILCCNKGVAGASDQTFGRRREGAFV